MTKHSSTFGLKVDKLTELLRIGADEEQSSPAIDCNSCRTNQLRDALAKSIPLECPESVHPLLQQLCRELLPLSGQSQGEFLTNPKTELVTLEKIKSYHKFIAASSKNDIEKEISGVIYYAAIASALIYHNAKISQHSFEQLSNSFATLLEKEWIDPDICELFDRAIVICRSLHKEEQSDG